MDSDNPLAIVLRDGVGMSPTIGELTAALASVQAEITPAEQDAYNKAFGSKYASLKSCIENAKPHLAANGLALSQLPYRSTDGAFGTVAILMHKSGEWLGGSLAIPVSDGRSNLNHIVGSILTYCRRYQLSSIIGFATGEDVDGNHANQKSKPKSNQKPKAKTKPKPKPRPELGVSQRIDTKSPRFIGFQACVTRAGLNYYDLAAWCKAHNRPRPSEMTQAQLDKCEKWLDRDGAEAVQEWLGKLAADEPQ